MKFMVILEER